MCWQASRAQVGVRSRKAAVEGEATATCGLVVIGGASPKGGGRGNARERRSCAANRSDMTRPIASATIEGLVPVDGYEASRLISTTPEPR